MSLNSVVTMNVIMLCHYTESYAECYCTESLCWMSLCWMSLCWLSLYWMSSCWMSLYWMSLCWMSLCLMSICWMSLYLVLLCWISLCWMSQCWMLYAKCHYAECRGAMMIHHWAYMKQVLLYPNGLFYSCFHTRRMMQQHPHSRKLFFKIL